MKFLHTQCLKIRGEQSKCPCNPCENYFFSSLSIFVKSFKEEIQPFRDKVDTARS